MSRSYRKGLRSRRHHHGPVIWECFRTKERECITKELHSTEYGDVVFPLKDYNATWIYDWFYYFYAFVSDTRREFYVEIQHILNNFIDHRRVDLRNDYLKAYRVLKKHVSFASLAYGPYTWPFIPPSNRFRHDRQSWLYTKVVREIIKKWEGDPIDLLYYLLEHKVIEKAVSEYKHYRYNKGR
jgi:hypothetical protein